MHFVLCMGILCGSLNNTKPMLNHKPGLYPNKPRVNVFTVWNLQVLRDLEDLAQSILIPSVPAFPFPFTLSSMEMGKTITVKTPYYIGSQSFLLGTGHWVPKHFPEEKTLPHTCSVFL